MYPKGGVEMEKFCNIKNSRKECVAKRLTNESRNYRWTRYIVKERDLPVRQAWTLKWCSKATSPTDANRCTEGTRVRRHCTSTISDVLVFCVLCSSVVASGAPNEWPLAAPRQTWWSHVDCCIGGLAPLRSLGASSSRACYYDCILGERMACVARLCANCCNTAARTCTRSMGSLACRLGRIRSLRMLFYSSFSTLIAALLTRSSRSRRDSTSARRNFSGPGDRAPRALAKVSKPMNNNKF